MDEINRKINVLNKKGYPVIFMITGNNSSGKTKLTNQLIKDLNFYQTINLGLASKLVRYFRPDIDATHLENFNGNEASRIFKDLIEFIVDSYTKTGVNVIIEGVQIDTEKYSKDSRILGGVILGVDESTAVERGNMPETHFLRKLDIKDLKQISYEDNALFQRIDNNNSFEEAYKAVLSHIGKLLNEKITTYEK